MKQLIEALYRVDNELLVAFSPHLKKETKKPKPKPKKIEEEKKPRRGP